MKVFKKVSLFSASTKSLAVVALFALVLAAGAVTGGHRVLRGLHIADTAATSSTQTYTSSAGNFTFQYPSGWTVTANGTGSDEIEIQPTTSQASTSNALRLMMWVGKDPDPSYQPKVIPDGSVQQLSNGINLWISSSTNASRTVGSNSVPCPVMQIVNASKTHFSYALSNGQYLSLEGSYCMGEQDTPTNAYQQQLSSQDWQTAETIISSIQFN